MLDPPHHPTMTGRLYDEDGLGQQLENPLFEHWSAAAEFEANSTDAIVSCIGSKMNPFEQVGRGRGA